MLRLSTLYTILLILVGSAVSAHPGKTDYQDGHTCLKNCEEWDMHYDEYHLHDKDRNAIRTEGRKKSLKEPAPASEKKSEAEPLKEEAAAAPLLPTPEPQTGIINNKTSGAIVDRQYSSPVETEFVLTYYELVLLGVAGLLLLIMLLLRLNKREKRSP